MTEKVTADLVFSPTKHKWFVQIFKRGRLIKTKPFSNVRNAVAEIARIDGER